MQDVLRYYYDVPRWPHAKQMQWVLSTETVGAIGDACGVDAKPRKPAADDDSEYVLAHTMLLGCPVRIDESVEGLSHEFVEGVPTWIHRDKAPVSTSL